MSATTKYHVSDCLWSIYLHSANKKIYSENIILTSSTGDPVNKLSLILAIVLTAPTFATPAFAMCCGKKMEMQDNMKCKPSTTKLKSAAQGSDAQYQSRPKDAKSGSGAGGEVKTERGANGGGCCCCKKS